VDAQTFTKQAGKVKQMLSARQLMVTVFWDRKGVLMVKFMQQGTPVMKSILQMLKICVGPYRTKGMECSSMTMHVCIQLLALERCWSFSTGS
jgi:hypothetical protein